MIDDQNAARPTIPSPASEIVLSTRDKTASNGGGDASDVDSHTGPPPRAPGASPVPEVDVHALHAYRNWLLAKAAQRLTVTNQTLVKGTSVAPSGRTRIGESRAICRLLESIAHPAVVPAKPPPGVVDGSTRDAVFSLSDGVSLVNDELGYGETVSDTMSFVKGDSLESTTYYSRRTRTGRQRLAAAPQEPPAVSVPEAKLKLP